MKKRIGILLLAVMCVATALSGCGGKKTSSQKGSFKVLLTLNAMDTFRETLVNAAKEEAAANGVQLEVMDAQDMLENQADHIRQAKDGNYDMILCGPVSADTALELKAAAGDIPILFFNSAPADKQLVADKYMYVGSDERVAGQFQAQYVLDRLADKDEINVVLLKGPANHSATAGRTKGVKQALAKSGKKIHYVFEDNADWSEDKAKEMFEIFLGTGAPVDCVICNNDSMALGVVLACREAGIDTGSLPILGVDATAEGCAAIKSGEMAFTVYQSGSGQGKALIQTALAILNGSSAKEVEGISKDGKYVWVPFEKVDSSNVEQYMQ